jgi:hypothetical protein
MRAHNDGFELTFTQPVDPVTASAVDSYTIETYTYIYQASYGSPEVDKTTPIVKTAIVAKNGLSVRLIIEGMAEGHVHEMHFPGLRSAKSEPLLHPAAYYTLNYLPQI